MMTTPGEKFPVMEIFGPTIQGEGIMAGKRCHFIRFGGCDYRCSWCDSMHAVTPELVHKDAKWLLPFEIADALESCAVKNGRSQWVTLSGGNPVMWDLKYVVHALKDYHWKIAVETQGSQMRDWLQDVDLITVSPKPPSSKMADKFEMKALGKWVELPDQGYNPEVVFKVVIFDMDDLRWARDIHLTYPFTPFYLSVGTYSDIGPTDQKRRIYEDYKWLCETALQDDTWTDVTILPQLHVLAWGQEKGR